MKAAVLRAVPGRLEIADAHVDESGPHERPVRTVARPVVVLE